MGLKVPKNNLSSCSAHTKLRYSHANSRLHCYKVPDQQNEWRTYNDLPKKKKKMHENQIKTYQKIKLSLKYAWKLFEHNVSLGQGIHNVARCPRVTQMVWIIMVEVSLC